MLQLEEWVFWTGAEMGDICKSSMVEREEFKREKEYSNESKG